MGIAHIYTELSAQYVDHNLLQTDAKNADDHVFLHSACQKFGLWYRRPGNGVSHPVHMECFGIPGKTLLGSDSHTCAAGALGMLAIGAGGLEVVLAMAGEPYTLPLPKRNILNFGILPLTFTNPEDWQRITQGDILCLLSVQQTIHSGSQIEVQNQTRQEAYMATHSLTEQQVEIVLAGGLLNVFRERCHPVSLSETP